MPKQLSPQKQRKHFSATYSIMERTGLPERTVVRFLKQRIRHHDRAWWVIESCEIDEAVRLLLIAKRVGARCPLLYLKTHEKQISLFDFV